MDRLALGFVLSIALACCTEPAPGADAGSPDTASDAAVSATIADGTLGPWTAVASLPTPLANHCAAVASGHLIVIGGNYRPDGAAEFVTSDAIYTAPLDGAGGVGAWTRAGTAPGPVSECVATADGDRLFVTGGLWQSGGDGGTVYSARVGDDGSVEPLVAVGTLPGDVIVLSTELWHDADALHLIHARLPNEEDETRILSAPAGESVGPWTVAEIAPQFRGRPQIAAGPGAVYLLGGYIGGNEVVTDSRGAVRDGDSYTAFDTEPLPAPRAFGDAVVVDGFVFVLGGRSQLFSGAVSDTVSAPIGGDGAIGAFTATEPLLEPRTNFRAVVAGDHVFAIGGGNDGPGLDTVWSARVRFER